MGSFFCFIPMGLLDFFKKKPTEDQKEKLDSGLEKTRTSLLGKLSKVIVGKSRIDDDFLDPLNFKIKFREGFRPFAPSVLSEEVSNWFNLENESPYMSLVANIKENNQS